MHHPQPPRLCSMEGCGRKHKAKGYCQFHYDRLWSGRNLTKPAHYHKPFIHSDAEQCALKSCQRPARTQHLCAAHAQVPLNYGMSRSRYIALFEKQDYRCIICKEKPQGNKGLNLDHDHQTGQIRALLCGNCNRMIGLARENPEFLRRAAAYLDSYMLVAV